MSNYEDSGFQYEKHCADYLKKNGYSEIWLTPKTGDQGIDIIAFKDGKKYGFQCKLYSGPVGNKAIQEAFTGAAYYHCDIAVVMTNSSFTKSAIQLGHKIGVKMFTNNTSIESIKAKMDGRNQYEGIRLSRDEKVEYMIRFLVDNGIKAVRNKDDHRQVDFFVYFLEKKIGVVCIFKNRKINAFVISEIKDLKRYVAADEMLLVTDNWISDQVKDYATKSNVKIASVDELLTIQNYYHDEG